MRASKKPVKIPAASRQHESSQQEEQPQETTDYQDENIKPRKRYPNNQQSWDNRPDLLLDLQEELLLTQMLGKGTYF
jgi:hypothetical protein